MRTKSIQVFFCFFLKYIYMFICLFSPPLPPLASVPVALWDASISGCLGSRRPLPSNKATAARWPLPLPRLHRIAFLIIIYFPLSHAAVLFFFFPALPSPSIATSANFDAAFTSTLLLSVGFSGPGPSLLTTACLSLRQKAGEKKLSLRLSINVLSLDFLFPSVYLSV